MSIPPQGANPKSNDERRTKTDLNQEISQDYLVQPGDLSHRVLAFLHEIKRANIWSRTWSNIKHSIKKILSIDDPYYYVTEKIESLTSSIIQSPVLEDKIGDCIPIYYELRIDLLALIKRMNIEKVMNSVTKDLNDLYEEYKESKDKENMTLLIDNIYYALDIAFKVTEYVPSLKLSRENVDNFKKTYDIHNYENYSKYIAFITSQTTNQQSRVNQKRFVDVSLCLDLAILTAGLLVIDDKTILPQDKIIELSRLLYRWSREYGEMVALSLPQENHDKLIEDIVDLAVFIERKDESFITLDELKQLLK